MVCDAFLINRIRIIMSETGTKQKHIAELIGVQPHDFSNMLNGRKQILSVHVPLIAKALNISISELYAESDDNHG